MVIAKDVSQRVSKSVLGCKLTVFILDSSISFLNCSPWRSSKDNLLLIQCYYTAGNLN